MHSIISFAVLAALVCIAVPHGADAQNPSAPACTTYVCPPTDLGGFPVSPSGSYRTATIIHCGYPTTPFFCEYNIVSGALALDNDIGACPLNAATSCPFRRRRDAIPRSPRDPSPGARSPKPENMQTRSRLGASKKAKREERRAGTGQAAW